MNKELVESILKASGMPENELKTIKISAYITAIETVSNKLGEIIFEIPDEEVAVEFLRKVSNLSYTLTMELNKQLEVPSDVMATEQEATESVVELFRARRKSPEAYQEVRRKIENINKERELEWQMENNKDEILSASIVA